MAQCNLQYTASGRARIWSAVVFAASLAILMVAASLDPDPAGHGTHEQMGLPECSWIAGGIGPCPTCGMTTAFALAADGRLLASFATQPFAAAAALILAMTVWVAGYTMVTGSGMIRWLRPLPGRLIWIAGLGLFLAAWAYKYLSG